MWFAVQDDLLKLTELLYDPVYYYVMHTNKCLGFISIIHICSIKPVIYPNLKIKKKYFFLLAFTRKLPF